jgi:hypothetical protein
MSRTAFSAHALCFLSVFRPDAINLFRVVASNGRVPYRFYLPSFYNGFFPRRLGPMAL